MKNYRKILMVTAIAALSLPSYAQERFSFEALNEEQNAFIEQDRSDFETFKREQNTATGQDRTDFETFKQKKQNTPPRESAFGTPNPGGTVVFEEDGVRYSTNVLEDIQRVEKDLASGKSLKAIVKEEGAQQNREAKEMRRQIQNDMNTPIEDRSGAAFDDLNNPVRDKDAPVTTSNPGSLNQPTEDDNYKDAWKAFDQKQNDGASGGNEASSEDKNYDDAWKAFDDKQNNNTAGGNGSSGEDSEGGRFRLSLPDLGDKQSNEQAQFYVDKLTEAGGDRAQEYLESGKGQEKLFDIASDKLGGDIADKYLSGLLKDKKDKSENTNGNNGGSEDSYIPRVKSQESLCESETAKKAKEFRERLSKRTCDNIETKPDPENSRFKYESKDGGCSFQLPGLPPMETTGTGPEPERCKGISAITGATIDMGVGMLNESWNDGLDNINSKVEEEAGINTGKWTNDYKDAPFGGNNGMWKDASDQVGPPQKINKFAPLSGQGSINDPSQNKGAFKGMGFGGNQGMWKDASDQVGNRPKGESGNNLTPSKW